MTEPRPRSFIWPVRLPRRGPGEPGWQLVERLRAARLRMGVAFAIFLGINLILFAAYLWSRGGQTTHVTIEANADSYIAQIDGHILAKTALTGPEQGGIAVILNSTESVPSLPKPRGIDSIKVLDTASGETLFEDDFSPGPSPDWTTTGTTIVKDGVLGTPGEARLSLMGRDWSNIIVTATFRNFQSGAILVRAQSADTGVYYAFRPFRDYDSNFAVIERGQLRENTGGLPMELSRTETVKSLLSMVLHSYPYLVVLLAAAFVIVLVIQLAAVFGLPGEIAGLSDSLALAAAGGLAVFGFIITLFLNYSYGSHMPHVPDEVAYIFQAKLMATAHMTAPLPTVQEAFDFFYPPFFIPIDGRWAGIYPFGHPLILSLGVKVGAVWLIPPLVGGFSVLLTYAIGRKVYNARVGLLAAFLLVASPFYLMTASNLMSHNTAAFFLLCSLACIVFAERRPVLLGVLGGISFGLFFNTQQLPAVALVGPVGLLLASDLIPPERRAHGQKVFTGFLAGGLLMLGAYFLFNQATTGDPTVSVLSKTAGEVVGFGGDKNSSAVGIQNQQTLMAFLVLILNGWPLSIGLAFVLMPFLLATRRRWDWFLLMAIVCALGVYVLVQVSRIMHGPRYWYPATPLLMLLTARGAERAGEVLSDLAGRARQFIVKKQQAPQWVGALIVYTFVIALAGTAGFNWVMDRNTAWSDSFVPANARDLKGFNGIDNRLIKLIDDANLHNALVLVQGDCSEWQCYGGLFWLNNTTLDGDIVYARDVPERRGDLFRAYPDRRVYFARYNIPTYLSIYGSDRPLVPAAVDSAPLARDIPVPTPTVSPTPEATDPAEGPRRDEQRRDDLGVLAQALQAYYATHNAYPLSESLQSFCRYVDLDAGCAVIEILDPFPQDPDSDKTYWYTSDGATYFYIFAEMENDAGLSQCEGAPVRPEVPEERLYCVRGTPGDATPTPTITPLPPG
jgi:4-amino-4-deoxy-L-arabinose transferase-like glycosyltransferase